MFGDGECQTKKYERRRVSSCGRFSSLKKHQSLSVRRYRVDESVEQNTIHPETFNTVLDYPLFLQT